MSRESPDPATVPKQATGGLRPRRAIWYQVGVFFRRKPLGAFGAAVAVILILVAIFADFVATHDPKWTRPEFVRANPSSEAWFGGDSLGRDSFSRVVFGSRISLYVGILSSLIGGVIGLAVGVSSAYYAGLTDLTVQRVIDAMMSVPSIILAIAMLAALGASVNNVVIALSIIYVPSTVRVVRSQALAIKETDYVLAARSVGAGHWRIMLSHMVPNCFAVWMVIFTFHLGTAIITEASLSFLGIGSPPDVPTWGGMLREGANQMRLQPYMWLFPGAAIAIVVFAWNLLGDSLRDVLDPRLRGAG